MATYNVHYYWNPPRRKKQRYALIERVIDFSKAPVTAGTRGIPSKEQTTAWAAADILQAITIRAGQTVLGVTVEILTRSKDSGDRIQVGYGDAPAYWGEYSMFGAEGVKTEAGYHNNAPLYFSSADTIDITIRKAVVEGKVRLVVHLLEDDR